MTTSLGVPAMEWIFEEDLELTEREIEARREEWIAEWDLYIAEDVE